MQFDEVIRSRRSVKKFDSSHAVTDEELKDLFEAVVLSPSSFNLQHWRFVVVRDPATKAKLRKAAFDQEQVEAASAVIAVLGKLDAHEDAAEVFGGTAEAVRNAVVPMINAFYENKPAARRDEAIRSGSLAAMSLMLAAKNMGYATGPMIGFDPDAVSGLLGLDDQHLIVMLIVLGKQVGELRPRASRFGTETVVKLERLDGAGLV